MSWKEWVGIYLSLKKNVLEPLAIIEAIHARTTRLPGERFASIGVNFSFNYACLFILCYFLEHSLYVVGFGHMFLYSGVRVMGSLWKRTGGVIYVFGDFN
jgi:hypothetical protein